MKCIEVVREEDCKPLGLPRKKGFDILNLKENDFKPGFLNILSKQNLRLYYVRKPHNHVVGSILSDKDILRLKEVI